MNCTVNPTPAAKTGVGCVTDSINLLFDRLDNNNVTLLLEATAGQGTNLGYKFEHLAYLIDKVEDKSRIGVCIDTCHLFSSGYDIENKKLSYTSIDVYRDLHCWEMRFTWLPIGFRQSWNFTINIKSSMLQDLKLDKKRDFYDNY